MSRESQEIFDQTYQDYLRTGEKEPLWVAATGHLGASRSLAELTALYAEALEAGDHATAQALADELAPIRAAARVKAGHLPPRGD